MLASPLNTATKAAASGGAAAAEAAAASITLGQGDKQVAAALRSKRRANVAEVVEVDPNYKARTYPKTPAQAKHLASAIADNLLFAEFNDDQRAELVKAMQPFEVPAGQNVIVQGDQGDFFYVVEHGKFDIIVNGAKVAVFGDGTGNMSFGELALLYNSPRAATVQSSAAAKLWRIGRATFRNVVAQTSYNSRAKLKDTLRKGILEELDEEQLDRVVDVATVLEYKKGDHIIRKGDDGEVFYIIEEGSVICKNLPGGQNNNVLHAGDYFGERALIKKEPRAADVYAETDAVKLVALHREDFEKLLGHMQELLEHNMGTRLLLCVPMLGNLKRAERSILFSKLQLVEYDAGATIVEEGGTVHAFHILKEGEVIVSQSGSQTAVLGTGQWFGHKELKENTPCGAQFKASGRVECFVLDRQTYIDILAPLEESMRAGRMPSIHVPGVGAQKQREVLGLPFRELEQRATLGTGTFGRVKLVVHKPTGNTYALKMLSKAQIVELRQEKNVMNEKRILLTLDHPFILRLFDTFKDRNRLYMLMELVQGGELFSRLQTSPTPGRVPVSDARFYSACVLDAFEHMHSRQIVYRDLKPENLLIDRDGYIKVVDFGFAKVIQNRTYTLCGTPEYLSPELVLGKGHGKGVDYWALGVLIYEMVSGYSPFADHQNSDQMVICKNILRGSYRFPSAVRDSDLKDCVKLLLEKDTTRRLGCLRRGVGDIKSHRFFRNVDWDRLRAKKEKAPWLPSITSATDTSNFDPYDEDAYVEPYVDNGSNWDEAF